MSPQRRSGTRIIAGLLCAGALAVPVSGRAYLRAVVSQTPNPNSTCEGQLLDVYWNVRNHTWWLFQDPTHPSTIAGLDWNGVQTAMETATQAWQGVQCSDTTFQYMGSTTQFQIGYVPDSNNNQNIEVFREAACSDTSVVPANDPCLAADNCGDTYNCWGHEDDIIALTTTTFDENTGELVDSDTEFNATTNTSNGMPYYHFTDLPGAACGDPATTGCVPACADPTDPTEMNCVATDVQNTATHEFGHYLGLAHPPVPAATMYAYAPPGQTSKRILNQDDINGICDIYPLNAQTNWCVPPASTSAGSGTGTNCSALGTDAFGLAGIALGLRRRRLHRKKL